MSPGGHSQPRSVSTTAESLAPSRVIIEGVTPEIDGGEFPIKRVVGELVHVGADIFAEGHDVLHAVVLYRHEGEQAWQEVRMTPGHNDRWTASFAVDALGWTEYTVQAWVDRYSSWARELDKKGQAGQDTSSELLEGAALLREAAGRADGADSVWLSHQAEEIAADTAQHERRRKALDPALMELMDRLADRAAGCIYGKRLRIRVERTRARTGAWYEMFPRSASTVPGQHGTLQDLEARLPYVAGMGFDVLYLPPIHPVGRAFRKGPNNTLTPGPNDPGSPWAIGAAEGGHTAVLSDLGTIGDFDRVVDSARKLGLEIALDIAFQCSPDHPWVKEHPEWFRHRPDGTIKYAENPPKKYQDIYPLDFEGSAWKSLWEALRDVFLFWVDHGVSIFRVDNPHTKPFRFWDWVIGEVWNRHPETIFLSEAFTRPKLMKRLAKGGFTQSYSYFTWRNDKYGLTEYLTELTQTEAAEYMRPNFFANTPDILHEYLQVGGPAAFKIRLALAATLGATYGIYGPPFEQCVGTPLKPGSEEYLDSEKYQVRHWDLNRPGTIRDYVARINSIRRDNPALQEHRNLRFVHIDNPQIIAYVKSTADGENNVLTVVSLDPYHVQSGWIDLPFDQLGIQLAPGEAIQVHDLISDARYLWHGPRNFVQLDPGVSPAHIFRIRRRIRTEQDFDYYT